METDIKVKKQLYFDKPKKHKYKMQITDKETDKIIFGKELYLLLKTDIRAILRISNVKEKNTIINPIYSILFTNVFPIKINISLLRIYKSPC